MRVTENTNFGTVNNAISRTRERMEGLQVQATTTRKLLQPSDDPVGASKVLELRTDKMNNEQYQQNAKIAEVFLRNTDQALEEISEILIRGKEIALNQSSGPNSSEETRQGVGEEVHQLFLQTVAIANRRIGDRYLFGGYKTQTPPVDPEGIYHGDDGSMLVEIANDVFISMNVPGMEAFNTSPARLKHSNSGVYKGKEPRDAERGSSKEPITESSNDRGKQIMEEEEPVDNVNLFQEIQRLRIGVLAGNREGIYDTLDRFDRLARTIIGNRVKVGTRIEGIQSAAQALERHNVTNALLSSSLEDADMAQVVNDLTKEETVLRNSLASSKRLIQPTLLDFLR
jgi:flagellar hook-associated protein 3 FlgL